MTQIAPYRSTPVFTNDTLPDGLRKAHSTKAGVWGLLKVLRGTIAYIVEENGVRQIVNAPETVIILPQQMHRVELIGQIEMQVDFYHQAPTFDKKHF